MGPYGTALAQGSRAHLLRQPSRESPNYPTTHTHKAKGQKKYLWAEGQFSNTHLQGEGEIWRRQFCFVKFRVSNLCSSLLVVQLPLPSIAQHLQMGYG